MTDDLEVINRFEDIDDELISNSPIARYAPQLENEPDAAYRVFLMYLSIPLEYRTFDYMVNNSRYKRSTLKYYANLHKWQLRTEEYDRRFLAEKSAHAVREDHRVYQEDVIYQSLTDFNKLRQLWEGAVDDMINNRNFSPMDVQRLVSARNNLDNMARRAVGLPTSISQSKVDDSEEVESIEGYYLDSDGSLKQLKSKPGGN